MGPTGKEGLFLDLKDRGMTAEGIIKIFPPPVYFTAFVDGGSIPDKAALMEALAAAFRFPSYFGKNWDALLDCLRSLPDVVPAGGYVLVIRGSRAFLASSPKDLADFSDVAGEAREFLGKKFKIDLTVVLL
ncbi:MAG TPA: hypothetical protein DCS63_00800 [Elusimicrobia bacterium]|nr:hypothetical protein [Elusimicrobiota bacterium]